MHTVQLLQVPGNGGIQVFHKVPGVDYLVNGKPVTEVAGIGPWSILGQVDEDTVGGGGVDHQHLLPHDVGGWGFGDKLEASNLQFLYLLEDIGHNIAHVVHS